MLTIHGGDFRPGPAEFAAGSLTLVSPGPPERVERIGAGRLASVETLASEGGGRERAIAKALIGSLVFGPVAGLAALSAVRKRHEVTFLARLDDGRHFVAVGDDRTFSRLRDASKGAGRASRIEKAEDRRAERSAARAEELVARYKADVSEREAPPRPLDPPVRAPQLPARPVFGRR